MLFTLKSYAVVDCNNEVVAIDCGFNCQSLVKKMNKGKYINQPYRMVRLDGKIEGK